MTKVNDMPVADRIKQLRKQARRLARAWVAGRLLAASTAS
jgi:hypothetical protein